ncbi:SRPBCC family protein [Halomicroarcula sp. GCM10025709]|uniref:SRPBCC family protein n=1 Tax=Haloarcula TaxID=2237 RepID=UPI0024C447AF|nr:SRPBCC family protein [Halomicroarcula sp. YJ-61-S]
MERVSVARTFDATPEAVREAMADLEAFMLGAGFDDVTVEDDTIIINNRVGLFDIELVLAVVDDADAALAYEQRDGVFESMRTEYHVDSAGDGTTVTATTEYAALDLAVVGQLLDSTVVDRQRRKELDAQFDWLEARLD